MIAASSIDVEDGEWLLHLDSWVIQDGNFPDLTIGATFQSALEFEAIHLVAGQASHAPRRQNADYEVTGELRRRWRRVWVLDFGLHAYAEHLGWDRRQKSVKAFVRLSPDPFPFREIYARLPGMPRMTYRWNITGL